MKPFKITTYTRQKSWLNKLNWLAMALGAGYIYLAGDVYFAEQDLREALINLALGLFWVLFGYVNLFWNEPSHPDILLDDSGITVEEENETRLLNWDSVESIHLDNNSIAVHLVNGDKEELNIWTVEYKELQLLKQRLQEYANSQSVAYTSKF